MRKKRRLPAQRILRGFIGLIAVILLVVAVGYGYFRYQWSKVSSAPCTTCVAAASGAGVIEAVSLFARRVEGSTNDEALISARVVSTTSPSQVSLSPAPAIAVTRSTLSIWRWPPGPGRTRRDQHPRHDHGHHDGSVGGAANSASDL